METQEYNSSFDKYWYIFKRHWLSALGVFFPIFLISLLVLSLKKPTYEAEGKLSFQRTNTISSLTGVGTEISRLEPLVSERSNPIATEGEVLRSVPVVQETINILNLKNKKGEPLTIEEFIKSLTIKDIKGSDVLQISYQHTNPKTAADIVNTLMQVYLKQNILVHKMEVTSARIFLEKQLPKAESVVYRAEAALRHFKEKNQVVALTEEATRAVDRMADLQKQIGDSQSRIADLNAQAESIRNQLKMNSQQAVTQTSLSQSRGVQDIVTEIQKLETQLAAKRIILQDKHPDIINLTKNLAALKKILNTRIQNISKQSSLPLNQNLSIGELQQTLTAKLVELESTRLGLTNQVKVTLLLQADYRNRLESLPRLEQQQRELERQLEVAQTTYSLLLGKLQESRIAENQSIGNARVISTALVPKKPAFSLISSYISGCLIAILATIATIYILELRDKSIKTIDEAQALLEFTLLGVIPSFLKSPKAAHNHEELEPYNQRLVVRDTPLSPINEAYRMLRSNLKFISANKKLKVIVITSSVPREGKSTVAANLAITIAQMEHKVLLIDGDLRRPVQHKIWSLPNYQGLSDVIVDQTEVKTAVKKVMDNLEVLTSGIVSPNPLSLLDSKNTAALIQSFATNYDFVIIDAPSLTVAADAAILGQIADGVLFVVRPGVVDSVHAIAARKLLEKSGQNVLGQVVNAVIPQKTSHNYYYLNEEDYSVPSQSEGFAKNKLSTEKQEIR